MALGLRGVLRRDGQICKPRRGSSSFRGPDRVENFDHLNGAAGFRRFDNGEVAMIEVRRISEGVPLDFEVVVREGEGVTRHHVTMSREMCERLTAGKHTPERCLEAAFRFLLDREPKESILGRFDVTVISRYFPKFERELPHYLSRS